MASTFLPLFLLSFAWSLVFMLPSTRAELCQFVQEADDSIFASCDFGARSSDFENYNFSYFPQNVSSLYLTGNMGVIPKNRFHELQTFGKLKTIFFFYHAVIEDIEPGAFTGLNLTMLTFQHTTLTRIPTDLLNGMPSLSELHVVDHNITIVTNDTFLTAPAELRIFGLQHNNIDTIQDGAFSGLGGYLEELNLQDNNLEMISKEAFKGLVHLKRIILDRNPGLTVASGSFSTLQLDLLSMDANFGSSKRLPAGLLEGIASLRELSIEDNGLQSIDSSILKSVKDTLVKLDLTGNDFVKIPGIPLPKLQKLLLRNCNATEIQPGTFSSNSALKFLDLSENKMLQLKGRDIFAGLGTLETLLIESSSLNEVGDGLFVPLTGLQILDLSHNNLAALTDGLFQNLSSLNTLTLSGNRIQRVSNGSFVGLGGARDIFLDNNEIATLHAKALEEIPQVDVFPHDNPWNCDCNLLSLRNWVETSTNFTADISCSKPEEFHGQQLLTLTSDDLCPTESPVDVGLIIGMVFLAIFVILIVTGVAIFYIKRKKSSDGSNVVRLP